VSILKGCEPMIQKACTINRMAEKAEFPRPHPKGPRKRSEVSGWAQAMASMDTVRTSSFMSCPFCSSPAGGAHSPAPAAGDSGQPLTRRLSVASDASRARSLRAQGPVTAWLARACGRVRIGDHAKREIRKPPPECGHRSGNGQTATAIRHRLRPRMRICAPGLSARTLLQTSFVLGSLRPLRRQRSA
jgi:hypothetical protein